MTKLLEKLIKPSAKKNTKSTNGRRTTKKSKPELKPAVYLQKWQLKDCENDICKFEIDWYPHHSRRYKGFSLMIGSKFFGNWEFIFMSNEDGYLRENREDSQWIGKPIL